VRSGLCLIDDESIGLAPKIARAIAGCIERFAAHEMAILFMSALVRRSPRCRVLFECHSA
jgi:ABC-type branched-subunit amino acid transport system ATPase component